MYFPRKLCVCLCICISFVPLTVVIVSFYVWFELFLYVCRNIYHREYANTVDDVGSHFTLLNMITHVIQIKNIASAYYQRTMMAPLCMID